MIYDPTVSVDGASDVCTVAAISFRRRGIDGRSVCMASDTRMQAMRLSLWGMVY